MKSFITVVLVLSANFVLAGEISLKAADGFQLKADYYAGKSGQSGVVLLHQCNGDRSMYKEVGERLAKQGVHVIAMDFRGYGGSANNENDMTAMRERTKDRQEYMKLAAPIRNKWPSDVQAAADFLRERIGKQALMGVGGASCGGGQSLALAVERKISALMIFSSGMREEQLKKPSALDNTATLFIVSEEDAFSYKSTKAMFAKSGHPQSRMITYKGNKHGEPLYEQDPTLVDTIVSWFRIQLNADS